MQKIFDKFKFHNTEVKHIYHSKELKKYINLGIYHFLKKQIRTHIIRKKSEKRVEIGGGEFGPTYRYRDTVPLKLKNP
jgi:hypothetical protein